MEAQTTSYPYGERGAGGKFRKPPPRKPPSKPYDRPPPPLASVTKSQGWLSKLVDPAKSLLGGASRMLPSFFSHAFTLPPPASIDQTEADNRDHDVEVAPPKSDDGSCPSSQAVITSSKGAHPNEVPESLKRFPEPGEQAKGEQICTPDTSEISRIEQLIKGKAFSSDEIDHLIGILNSKTLEVHEAERGTREIVTATALESEGPLLIHQGRQEDSNRAIPVTPLPQLKVGGEIGASPIDIARAFMGSRKLESCSPGSVSAKAEGPPQLIESAMKPLISSPAHMLPPRQPDIMVTDQHDYETPLRHRGRYGLHDFPRTPYSRTIYSKSRAKPPADNRYPSSSSNFFQKSRTPIYGQAKTRDDVVQDHHGTAGPIRRMHSKFSSESRSRGSIFSKPLVEVPSGCKILPVKKNLEPNDSRNNSQHLPVGIAPSGSEEASSFLNPSTMQAVKRILDHLDRNKPTPKEKAAELERATAWRKSAASLRSDDLGTATTSLSHDNKAELVSKGNDGNTASDVQLKSPETAIKETKIAAQGRVSLSNLDGVSGMRNPVCAEFSSHFDSISGSAAQSSHEQPNNGMGRRLQKETSKHQIDNGINAQNHSFGLSKRPVADVTSSKRNLSSIAISKPVMSSDNGIGFTFPVSASFGVTSEPPTPSIMPSSSPTVALSVQNPAPAVPCYSFGSKSSSPPLVFSFPGGSIPSCDNASDLKFNFGSDKSSRLSFKSVGKGAVSLVGF